MAFVAREEGWRELTSTAGAPMELGHGCQLTAIGKGDVVRADAHGHTEATRSHRVAPVRLVQATKEFYLIFMKTAIWCLTKCPNEVFISNNSRKIPLARFR